MLVRSLTLGRIGLSLVLLALAGCGALRESLPPRTAMEQLLLSTAADRAVEAVPVARLRGKSVFVDAENLDCYDKPYVVQRVRFAVLEGGGSLSDNREEADVALEVASGALSVNKRDYLLGIPEIPLPVPFAAEPFKMPELPLFKTVTYRGRAKLIFCAVDLGTNRRLFEVPVCYGVSLYRTVRILILFSFRQTDLPQQAM